MLNKFHNGDRIRVNSGCDTYGKTGTITHYTSHPCGKYVQVQLDNGKFRTYNEESLELLNKKEEKIMKLSGNYQVAIVKFVQGTNTTTGYAFALYDDFSCGDFVLCDTKNGYGVAEIVNIIPQDLYTGTTVTKEIICRVDFSNFERRQENRVMAQKIQKEMDKKIKGIQEMMFYEMMADKDPELKRMLEQYKELIG